MAKPLIILGAGGHAKIVVDLCMSLGLEVAGVISPSGSAGSFLMSEIPILGADEILENYPPGQYDLAVGVGSTRSTSLRSKLYTMGKSKGYHFPSLCHNFTHISLDVEISEGVQIMAGSVVTVGVKLEENVLINTKSSIDHDTVIGRHTHIAPGSIVCGNVIIGQNSHISCGATIVNGITLGTNVFVAAGAVVIKNADDEECLYGLPAKNIISESIC